MKRAPYRTSPRPPSRLPTISLAADLEDAACRTVDPELFFQVRGLSEAKASSRTAAAKRVCGGCEVREACLREALVGGEQDGIWGGLTPGERRGFHSQLQDLLAFANGGDLTVRHFLRKERRLRPRDRPGAVLMLLNEGRSEEEVAQLLGMEQLTVRTARRTGERLVRHCRATGIRLPAFLAQPNRPLARAS